MEVAARDDITCIMSLVFESGIDEWNGCFAEATNMGYTIH